MMTASAIWEKNAVAVEIASGVWGINSAFLIQGKFLSSPSPDNLVI
jgi:hypothetical protein